MKIERLSAWEFPLTEPANYYYVETAGSRLLIDTGPKPSTNIPGSVEVVLLTHWHWDHTMGLSSLEGVKVCASEDTLKMLSNVENIRRSALTPIHAMGIAGDPQVEMLMASMFGRYSTIVSALARTDRYALEECGELLDRVGVRVLECPGHTRDHVCYIIGEGLFAGDTLLPNTSPTTIDYGSYLETLARLASAQWQTLYPGHGDSKKRTELAEYLSNVYRGKTVRLARLASSLTREWIGFDDLLRLVYGVSPGIESYVAARTLIGYLKFLEDQGIVKVDRESSPWKVRLEA